MSFNLSQPGDEEDEVLSAINTTPLVDVMLVLLIIFLITIPVVTHTVPVQLPKERSDAMHTKVEDINLAVTRDGSIYWNDQPAGTQDALSERLRQVAGITGPKQPEVHVRGDAEVPYELIGRVILLCQHAGIAKVGFITEPPPRG